MGRLLLTLGGLGFRCQVRYSLGKFFINLKQSSLPKLQHTTKIMQQAKPTLAIQCTTRYIVLQGYLHH